ncbi:MAG: cytochrome d ubiquinol oxidase subunit II [Candidatus Marinimicrobia bacterium]|nr:cytochrome d ubiquinol oxidase subunit II [Candidatus Neomarinimicrobiota bacterium]MCF7880234.1 cytochrome d ubiquinol oxidase subunit II [Candidatus Neomarinimicrobiota bacterium]
MDLNIIWFILVGILFAGYAMLDGFDLGIGALHLFTKSDKERRLMINSIGPVWDGNEVWLVTGGGALFAAFPEAYATVFSGFYIAFMAFLLALIFRAVAIEFRSKQPMKWWRQMWDRGFAFGSVLAAFLLGVAMGNIAYGIPLTENHVFAGSFFDLIRPYTVFTGITTVALFMMHGAIYGVLKTEGELHDKLRSWVQNTIVFFILSYAVTTIYTLLYVPQMTALIEQHPMLFVVPLITVLAIANIPREYTKNNDFRAFLSSIAAVLSLLALFGLGIYPNMVYSFPNPEHSLTIYNAASSQKTLKIMLIIASIGMPLVIGYTSSIYYIFRGKVKITEESY